MINFIIILIVIALFAIKFLNDVSNSDTKVINQLVHLPYRTKQTLMTSHERLLFENHRSVLGPIYDIYPQVNLDKIFSIDYQKQYKYYLGYLRKINQKSVDFLIVKRNTQTPLFGIEIDDSSHEREDRRNRDELVEAIFNKTGLPLIRFNPGQYKNEELKIIFEKYLV